MSFCSFCHLHFSIGMVKSHCITAEHVPLTPVYLDVKLAEIVPAI